MRQLRNIGDSNVANSVRATTWPSATQWHSAKCRSQKSGISHNSFLGLLQISADNTLWFLLCICLIIFNLIHIYNKLVWSFIWPPTFGVAYDLSNVILYNSLTGIEKYSCERHNLGLWISIAPEVDNTKMHKAYSGILAWRNPCFVDAFWQNSPHWFNISFVGVW